MDQVTFPITVEILDQLQTKQVKHLKFQLGTKDWKLTFDEGAEMFRLSIYLGTKQVLEKGRIFCTTVENWNPIVSINAGLSDEVIFSILKATLECVEF